MSRTLILRVAVAAVLAGLAIAGYLMWIPIHRPNATKLAALARTSPVTGLRGHPRTHFTDPRSSPIATVKKAGSSTPGETGSYALEWKGSKPLTSGSVSLDVLPTKALAGRALVQARSAALSDTALTAVGYGYGGKSSVQGIPGAKGAYYLSGSTSTVTAKTPRASVFVYRVGRVLVGINVDGKGKDATTTARALAVAQYRHLRAVGPVPELAETHVPLVASILYVLVALAVIAFAQLVPTLVVDARQRRLEQRAAAERRARNARGKKHVKRHASRGFAARVESRSHGRH